MDEQPTGPPPDNGPKVHEPKREEFKAFGKNWLIGTLILSLFSIIGNIGNSIGIQQFDIKTIASPADLLTVLTQINPQTGLFVFFSMVGVAAVTMLLVSSQVAFGKLFHLHRDTVIPDKQLNEQIRKDIRRLRIVPLAIWIVLVGIIVVPVVGGISVISQISIPNAHDILHIYTGVHITDVIMVIIGGAVVGWITRHMKNQYENIFNRIEPYLQKSRVL